MMWVDHSPISKHLDNIYVIWHNEPLVTGIPNDPPGVFVNRRTGPSGAWQTPIPVSHAETTGTAIGCDIKTNSAGDVFAFWADTGSKYLYVGKSSDGGASFSSNPAVLAPLFASQEIAIPSFASKPRVYISGGAYGGARGGVVYAVWMDLTGNAELLDCDPMGPGLDVLSPCTTRIWFSRSTSQPIGLGWEQKKMINNQNTLNDQFNPRLAVDQTNGQRLAVDQTNGQLMVIYYDTQDDNLRLKADLWMQTSEDEGLNWSASCKVTTAQTDETVPGADLENQYGDYNGLSGYASTFFPSWTDRRGGLQEEIWSRRLRVQSLPEETCPVDPILTSATIYFGTGVDDKDRETYLIVEVNTVYGENAARIESFSILNLTPIHLMMVHLQTYSLYK
jgi:hypothetical protein